MPHVVADIGEAGVIARVREAVSRAWPNAPHVRIGLGDDAAVLEMDGACAVATDSLVEGVHFRREWVSAQAVGSKLAARNFADIVAMGARPRALLLALAMPADTTLEWLDGFINGVVAETMRAGAVLVGGDTSVAPFVMASATAIGDACGTSVTRAGARAGDVVAVSGLCGAAASGLALLSAGLSEPASAIAAYGSPRPDYSLALRAADTANSMIDCSDGLVNDLGHIARASGCDLRLRAAAIPRSDAAVQAASVLGRTSDEWVLTGGEDHIFLATFPRAAQVPEGFTVIGDAVPGPGQVWIDDQVWAGVAGYQHFADTPRT